MDGFRKKIKESVIAKARKKQIRNLDGIVASAMNVEATYAIKTWTLFERSFRGIARRKIIRYLYNSEQIQDELGVLGISNTRSMLIGNGAPTLDMSVTSIVIVFKKELVKCIEIFMLQKGFDYATEYITEVIVLGTFLEPQMTIERANEFRSKIKII